MKPFHLFCFLLLLIGQFSHSEELKPDLTIQIPMRDGVSLPTDLYLPHEEARGLPCILLRSPAGRQAHCKSFAEIAKKGYVVAIQETRNVLDTEGKTLPYITDGWGALQDGHDTVAWLAKSPFTNGKIGTWGSSALGITQFLMAPTAPSNLQCQYIIFAAPSLYHHALYPGGQLLKHQAESWLGYYAKDPGVLCYVSHRPFYNDFWKSLNTLLMANHIKTPAIHIGGWYDTFIQGTLHAFATLQYEGGEGARSKQKLIIGPWTHFWPLSQQFGDFAIPAAGYTPPIDISPERWFDFHLKEIDNGIDQIPAVTYFVMGPFDGSPSSGNVWKTADRWPVPAESTSFYLTEEHRLQKSIPTTQAFLSYAYDPHHPIPTLGGRNLFLESGPKDQQSIENREDILVFTSPILNEEMEVTGPLIARLYFSTDQKDTDIVVRLCDVYPDGRSILISDGVFRLATMCHQNPESLDKIRNHQPIEAEVDLAATSFVFAKGHQIRISVSSSNYPRYERNFNTGLLGASLSQSKVALNKVWFGKEYPSRLILPIVPKNPS